MSSQAHETNDSGLLSTGPRSNHQRFDTSDDRSIGDFSTGDAADVWLDGDNVLCACPDCGSAINIRVWLMIADCWNCATSIQLTLEAQAAIDEFVRERDSAPKESYRDKKPLPGPDHATDSDKWRPPSVGVSKPEPQAKKPSLAAPVKTSIPPRQYVFGISHATSDCDVAGDGETRLFDWIHDLPAWLTSLVLHLIALLLLGLFVQHRDHQKPTITLSMAVSKYRTTGDRPAEIAHETRFDLPAPDDRPRNPRETAALMRANEEAKLLRIDQDSIDPNLTALTHVKSLVRSTTDRGRGLATRDPRLRRELIYHEGGTALTEAAVARGLHWLSTVQHSDGSWSLRRRRDRSAGTSLALLPFLGAGQTHLVGIYRDTVAGGLRYLLEGQGDDGSLRGDANDQHYMYVHGQATIVLCETFAMTHDERFRIPAQKAVDFIVAAQYPRGGWRYKPRAEDRKLEGDTSVLGWQVMALQSARMAGLYVPEPTLQLAHQYLDLVSRDNGATYAYQRGRPPTRPMTAEGQLCRIYLGWQRTNPALSDGVEYLLDELPTDKRRPNYYAWYYATQVMHHLGGKPWHQWNRSIRNTLVNMQETRGRDAGSWPNNGRQGAGRLYSTALAVCTLEVYYRHAPIFRRIDLD